MDKLSSQSLLSLDSHTQRELLFLGLTKAAITLFKETYTLHGVG